MTPPESEDAWRDLVRSGMPPCWGLIAAGTGGSVFERGDVTASIIPRAPDRSIFNSVFYEDRAELMELHDEIALTYEQAGVNAWTVWVPEADTETAGALERAGHANDGAPRYMGMPLAELREPDRDPEMTIREDEDYAEMARINEIAYGYPPGDYGAVADAPMPGARLWFADIDGEPVSTLGVWPHESDGIVIWVATLPEARGKGVAAKLLHHALAAAREDGLETTTLQSSKLGRPVYERLGYRDFGAGQLWEMRVEAE